MKECDGGHEVYRMDKEGVLRKCYHYDDNDRKGVNRDGLSFPEFLLVRYGENQEKGLIWDDRFEEWCNNNPNTATSMSTSIYENLNPIPKDYPFKDWLFIKVGHTNVSEPVKKTLLKSWLIDCFRDDVVKDPRKRSFDDYKWMFDLEIDQLADEYDLGIGKKGHLLDDIWENYRKVQGNNTYWWHDQKSKEEERRQLRVNIEEYDPPIVHVETFEVKRYSFDTGQSFICVTKELMDALPLGRENGSRFREMIRKEVDSGSGIHKKTFSLLRNGIRSPLISCSCGSKIERLIIDGKVTLMDNEGKPLENVDSLDDHDSEDEVESIDNEMASFLASKKVGYGTNSMLE
ncbi:hypothetical protein Tco_0643793 [Tanacetum coccineum]